MGKKRREEKEGNETYEVWSAYIDGTWKQLTERDNGGIFPSKQRALLLAQNQSMKDGIIETLVIERRPIASFNGPAISAKGRFRAVEEKKEVPHAADVHGDRPEAGQVVPAGDGLGRKGDLAGRGGEADSP